MWDVFSEHLDRFCLEFGGAYWCWVPGTFVCLQGVVSSQPDHPLFWRENTQTSALPISACLRTWHFPWQHLELCQFPLTFPSPLSHTRTVFLGFLIPIWLGWHLSPGITDWACCCSDPFKLSKPVQSSGLSANLLTGLSYADIVSL